MKRAVLYAALLGAVALGMLQTGRDMYRDHQASAQSGGQFSAHAVLVEKDGHMKHVLLAVDETTNKMYITLPEGDAAQVLDASLAEEILEDDEEVLKRLVTGVAAIRLDAVCTDQRGCMGEIIPLEVHASMEGEVSVNRRGLATGEVANSGGYAHGTISSVEAN